MSHVFVIFRLPALQRSSYNICKSLAYSAEENVCFALLYLPKLVVSFKRKVLCYGLVLHNVPIF